MQQNQSTQVSKSSSLLLAVSTVLIGLVVAPAAVAAANGPITSDLTNILALSGMWSLWCFWWQLRLARY